MGIGMILSVNEKDTDAAVKALEAIGETSYVIGKVTTGDKGVILC
jgi:phosphoribosylformylglycinamidine cyclo-ligase